MTRRQRRRLALLVLLLLVLVVASSGAAVLYKRGVQTAFRPELSRALPDIEAAHREAGITRGAVITGGTEPEEHSLAGLHPLGLALDLRTRDLAGGKVDALERALRRRLNGGEGKNRPYQVVRKPNHLHVEYQPTAGWRPAS